jgi:hypothetical protein
MIAGGIGINERGCEGVFFCFLEIVNESVARIITELSAS